MSEVVSMTLAFYKLHFPLFKTNQPLSDDEISDITNVLIERTGLNIHSITENSWVEWEFPNNIDEDAMTYCNDRIMASHPHYDFIWRCIEVKTTISKYHRWGKLIAKQK